MSTNNSTCQAGTSSGRLPPQPASAMRPEWVRTLERIPGAGLKGKFFPAHVLGVLMHSPEVFGPFLEYWVTSKLKMGFSIREQELIILRMGCLFRCDYVWRHHVPVAREFGVSDAELAAVKVTPLPAVFTQRESALLHLTDELIEQRTVRPEVWAQWSGALNRQELVDLVHIVSQYVLFALMNNTMQVQLEAPMKDIPAL